MYLTGALGSLAFLPPAPISSFLIPAFNPPTSDLLSADWNVAEIPIYRDRSVADCPLTIACGGVKLKERSAFGLFHWLSDLKQVKSDFRSLTSDICPLPSLFPLSSFLISAFSSLSSVIYRPSSFVFRSASNLKGTESPSLQPQTAECLASRPLSPSLPC